MGASFGRFWWIWEPKLGPKIDPKSITKVVKRMMPKNKRKKCVLGGLGGVLGTPCGVFGAFLGRLGRP